MQYIKNEIGEIYRAVVGKPLFRPVFLVRVQAGFPSPAESYIEGSIDLNRDLQVNKLTTFYVRVIGDSMEPDIMQNSLILVDRGVEAHEGDIVVACVNAEMCVKELSFGDDGRIYLLSRNPKYPPIEVREGDSFEVWGTVLHSINSFGRGRIKAIKGHAD
jgi:DNA polymerase V